MLSPWKTIANLVWQIGAFIRVESETKIDFGRPRERELAALPKTPSWKGGARCYLPKTPVSAVGPSASCFTLWVSFFRAPFLSPCCFNFPAPVWRALYATLVAGCVSEMFVVVLGAQRWNWVAQSQLQTPFMTRCLRYVTNLCCYTAEKMPVVVRNLVWYTNGFVWFCIPASGQQMTLIVIKYDPFPLLTCKANIICIAEVKRNTDCVLVSQQTCISEKVNSGIV